MTNSNRSFYAIARSISLIIAVLLFAAHLIWDRQTLFLIFNHDLGKIGDLFFTICTYLAEGWIWIPYFIVFYFVLKQNPLLLLLNFTLSTLLTQIPKHFIWDHVARPIASGIDTSLIHVVKGMEIFTANSFPSGHSATAFTLFLLSVKLLNTKKSLIIGLFYAIFCAYSRVYLGQHFPLDVAGGITVALLSVEISNLLYKKVKHV